MKCLGVYGEENPSEPTFLLRLVNNHDGSYTLAAVDKNGEIIDGGYLGRIDKHGFRRYTSVNDELGFRLEKGSGQLYDVRH